MYKISVTYHMTPGRLDLEILETAGEATTLTVEGTHWNHILRARIMNQV